jgi:xanthine dehydrogenase accessory factor
MRSDHEVINFPTREAPQAAAGHNRPAVESSVGPLLSLFEQERAAGRPMALGVVLETAGSTYRKPGALMLFASGGEFAGLLSGGCLEGDLREHSGAVISSGVPHTVSYDLRGPDDLLWGLGLGCEGAMRIVLMRVGPEDGWQPLAHFSQALTEHRSTAVALVVESSSPGLRAGSFILPEAAHSSLRAALDEAARSGHIGWVEAQSDDAKLFSLPLTLPPRVLVLGAGPDALPVVELAARLGWKVTIADHRAAYAQADHFPGAHAVVQARSDELAKSVDLRSFTAAVVMSHHLPSDLEYLRALAASSVPYVGLLGPAIRREKLIGDLGSAAEALRWRLRAPVGLALGGRTPESIALAIVAEIHAFVHGADARPYSAP